MTERTTYLGNREPGSETLAEKDEPPKVTGSLLVAEAVMLKFVKSLGVTETVPPEAEAVMPGTAPGIFAARDEARLAPVLVLP